MKKKQLIKVKGSAEMQVPLSPALAYGELLFLSGQVAKDMITDKPLTGSIEQETEEVLKNIESLLKEAGSSLDCVLKTTCFLTNRDDFAKFNQVYSKFFSGMKPTRSTVIVTLAGDFKVEIEAIAYIPQ